MDNKRRGLALIFNQERFFWRLGLNDRHGTNADRYNLERRLNAHKKCRVLRAGLLENLSVRVHGL